ncbi:hypothetical protein [Spirosoma sordidisoli]|uniref:Uncharacterized protein n=1 Tax=Spirosoma sordidisoli TaxID=2502893 RepID=A0A4Q2UBD1_9BACT|nr:hypothetical protein [Spirosoma sordidisoli]RYC66333.1 hypothetical protein EQG79_30120 [Spirosoma sordidisoli]
MKTPQQLNDELREAYLTLDPLQCYTVVADTYPMLLPELQADIERLGLTEAKAKFSRLAQQFAKPESGLQFTRILESAMDYLATSKPELPTDELAAQHRQAVHLEHFERLLSDDPELIQMLRESVQRKGVQGTIDLIGSLTIPTHAKGLLLGAIMHIDRMWGKGTPSPTPADMTAEQIERLPKPIQELVQKVREMGAEVVVTEVKVGAEKRAEAAYAHMVEDHPEFAQRFLALVNLVGPDMAVKNATDAPRCIAPGLREIALHYLLTVRGGNATS